MIHCNGLAKCGTHALQKAIELLGVPFVKGSALMSRVPYDSASTGPGSVYIYRHPKRWLVSLVRQAREDVVTQGFLISTMHDVYPLWMSYEPFLSDSDTLSVRLEDLIGDGGGTLRAIADHIGTLYLEDAYANIPGMTHSFNKVPSTWEPHSTPETEAAWIAARGPEVEKAFGYGG